MNFKRFALVARIALPAMVLAFALPAFSEVVSWTTTGVFTGAVTGSGTDQICLGVCGAGQSGVTVTADVLGPQNNIDLSSYPGGEDDVLAVSFVTTATISHFNAQFPANGVNFTLTITQTAPSGGTGDFSASLNGTLKSSGGTAEVDFCPGGASSCAPPTIQLGNVQYQLFPTSPVNLGLPSGAGIGNAGVTNIDMAVTPEPTFMTLTGLGFAGLAFVAYRRKRTV